MVTLSYGKYRVVGKDFDFVLYILRSLAQGRRHGKCHNSGFNLKSSSLEQLSNTRKEYVRA